MKQTRVSFRVTITVLIGVMLFMLLGVWTTAAAEETTTGKGEVLEAVKAEGKVNIDGVLDDKVWQTPPIKKTFISYQPLYGDVLPQETLAWVAYDKDNLYFAFLCNDTEPEKIQTSITKRDNITNDDWVSVAIDSSGNGQTAYVLYVNPNGIQQDGLASSISEGEDISPDLVWESAAKTTDKGYQVEICLPLKSISFKSGKKVEMGLLFRRKITRLNIFASWPDIKLAHSILDSQAKVEFKDLKKQLKLELLPSLTHSNNRTRISGDEWGESDKATDIGIDLKYGITSAITAEVTVNPDFSQVESDAFQVDVNRRYPLFYREKRPFFMAGLDNFNFWTYPYGFLQKSVHTRQIVDPLWGAKLTGNVGKFAFGLLSAGDEYPGQPSDYGINPNEGKDAFYGVFRGKYSLSGDNYIGFIYSGREFADEYNRVVGVDAGFRITEKQRIRASFLQSMSRDEAGNKSDASASNSYNITYTYGSKPLQIVGLFEHIGEEFRMDTAYMLRNAVDHGLLACWINFYPKQEKTPWLKRVSPFITAEYTHDLVTELDDSSLQLSVDLVFIKDASLSLGYIAIKESWNGETFDLDNIFMNGQIQLTNWLRIVGNFSWAESIYYYANPSFTGSGYNATFALAIQPNQKIRQVFQVTHSDFSTGGEKLYDVNLLYSKTTYQFNKYFYLRGVVQYNSYQKRILTDFLASFTLIPGTVLHVGYGGLYEKRTWLDNQWMLRTGDMLNIKRSFFAKISYLWRF